MASHRAETRNDDSPGISCVNRMRKPAAGKSAGPESGHDVATAAQQLPHQSRFVVLDHQDDRPLIETAVPGRNPALWRATGIGKGAD